MEKINATKIQADLIKMDSTLKVLAKQLSDARKQFDCLKPISSKKIERIERFEKLLLKRQPLEMRQADRNTSAEL